MPAISHCHRREAVYYWRRWTPGPRRVLLQVGLGVKEARTARSLSLFLTAKSEELFPRYRAGQMNKTELLAYLHHCLAQSRQQVFGDGTDLLAQGMAGRVLEVVTMRWSDANADKSFRLQSFGGTMEAEQTFGGYTIPSQLKVGNLYGSPGYLPFFQARVTAADCL